MHFEDLLQQVRRLPLFSTDLLLSGSVSPEKLHKQLTLWKAAGKVIQLRRGLYTLAEPYRQIAPHPFTVANRLVSPSYVSLQSALAHHGLIPESVFQVTSITSRQRTTSIETPLGTYLFRHIQPKLFHGFQLFNITTDQKAYIARPEKALLDLIYLTPKGDQMAFIDSLRLQNMEGLDTDWLIQSARDSEIKKLVRGAEALISSIDTSNIKTYEI